MDTLEPCLCGATAEIAITRHKARHRYWGRCTKKYCNQQPDCFEVLSEAQAIEEWNISVQLARKAQQ